MGYYVKVSENTKVYVEYINIECKETIVFLHGWPGSHELFEYQFDYFLQKGYSCIEFKLNSYSFFNLNLRKYNYKSLCDII